MIKSLREIINYKDKLPVCIETQGSIVQKIAVATTPVRVQKDFKITEIKIWNDLNIRHLNLAFKALNFNRYKFVKQIQNKIFAIEVSHNFRKLIIICF